MRKQKRTTKPVTRRPRLPDGEKRITFKQAGGMLDPPRPTATIYTWANSGMRGITLEYERQAGLVFTSREAVERFLDRTGQSNAQPAKAK